MAEEQVTILAVLKDGISNGAVAAKKSLDSLAGGVQSIAKHVQGFALSWSGLLTGFLTVQGFSKAVAEFKAAELAATQLRGALGEDVSQFARLKQQADDIKSRTVLDDDDVTKLQATLLNRGVSLGQLDKAVEASIQTSQALGMSLEAAGNQIAITYDGIVPRSLKHAVSELKNLSEQELKAGGAADILAKKYKGFAEARAQTSTGKIEQAENALNDAYKELGKILTQIEAEVLPAVTGGIRNVLALLNGPESKAALKWIHETIDAVSGPNAENFAQTITIAFYRSNAQLTREMGANTAADYWSALADRYEKGAKEFARRKPVGIISTEDYEKQREQIKAGQQAVTDRESILPKLELDRQRAKIDSDYAAKLISAEQYLQKRQALYLQFGVKDQEMRKLDRAQLDALYKSELIDVGTYLDQRRQIEQREIEKDVADRRAELTSLGKTVSESLAGIEAQKRKVAALGDLLGTADDDTRPFLIAKQNKEAALLGQAEVEFNLTLHKIDDAEKSLATLNEQLDTAKLKGRQEDSATLSQRFGGVTGDLKKRADGIDTLAHSGALSPVEAEQQFNQVLDDQKEKYGEIAKAIQALIDEETNPEAKAKLLEQQQEFRAGWEKTLEATKGTVQEFGEELRNSIQGPMENLFASLFDRTKTAKEKIADFFKSIADNLAKMASKNVTNLLLNSVMSQLGLGGKSDGGDSGWKGASWLSELFHGLGGGSGSGGADASGNYYSVDSFSGASADSSLSDYNASLDYSGFADGGLIGHGSPTSSGDDAMIKAQHGEFMLNRRAVNHYGTDLLNLLNARQFHADQQILPIPFPSPAASRMDASTMRNLSSLSAQFANATSAPRVVEVPHVVQAIVAPTEEHASAMLESPGGIRTLIRAIGAYRTQVNSALGNPI